MYEKKLQRLQHAINHFETARERALELAKKLSENPENLKALRACLREYAFMGHHRLFIAPRIADIERALQEETSIDIDSIVRLINNVFDILKKNRYMHNEQAILSERPCRYDNNNEGDYQRIKSAPGTDPVAILHGGSLSYILDFLDGIEPGYPLSDGQARPKQLGVSMDQKHLYGLQVLPYDSTTIAPEKKQGKIELAEYYTRRSEGFCDFPAVLSAEIDPHYLVGPQNELTEAGLLAKFRAELKNITITLKPTRLFEVPPLELQYRIYRLTDSLSFLDNLPEVFREENKKAFKEQYPEKPLLLSQKGEKRAEGLAAPAVEDLKTLSHGF